jgi:hypothetical protein
MEDLSVVVRGVIVDFRRRFVEIPESDAAAKTYAEKWSLKEILGHLIDSAMNNLQRIIRMQEKPDIGAFVYSPDHWVRCQHNEDEPWETLVQLWSIVNDHIAHVIHHVDPRTLPHTCDMGYARRATLAFVMEDYVRHVRHHAEQIMSGADPRQRVRWVARDPGAQ